MRRIFVIFNCAGWETAVLVSQEARRYVSISCDPLRLLTVGNRIL